MYYFSFSFLFIVIIGAACFMSIGCTTNDIDRKHIDVRDVPPPVRSTKDIFEKCEGDLQAREKELHQQAEEMKRKQDAELNALRAAQ